MRKSLWFMLAVLFVAIVPPDARANDTVVTLDVSGTMLPVFAGGCAPSPCTLGGNIVIDNTLGFLTSVNITLAGASPSQSPFIYFVAFVPQDSMLVLGNNTVDLGLTGIDTLVGYTGGPTSLPSSLSLPSPHFSTLFTRAKPPSRRPR